eukprot:5204767-Karenia_brevis.AAC.1
MAVLKRLLRRFQVVLLQETHGSSADFLVELASFSNQFEWEFSVKATPVGGVITLISKSITEQTTIWENSTL